MQYQLTTRELQYAQGGVRRDDEPPWTTVDGVRIPSQPCPDPSSPHKPEPASELEENRKSSSLQDRKAASPWRPSFSSDDRSSLQEVWKLLDEESPGLTPRGIRVDEEVSIPLKSSRRAGSSSTSGSFTIKGQPRNFQPKPSTDRRMLSVKAAGRWKPSQQKAKVRNYNIKDEESTRLK